MDTSMLTSFTFAVTTGASIPSQPKPYLITSKKVVLPTPVGPARMVRSAGKAYRTGPSTVSRVTELSRNVVVTGSPAGAVGPSDQPAFGRSDPSRRCRSYRSTPGQ